MTRSAPIEDSAELALLSDPETIESASNAAEFVLRACGRATELLQAAVERGDINYVGELKNAASAYDTYVKQKKLSLDAKLAASELVRRAERGVCVTIKMCQDAGTVYHRGDTSTYERAQFPGHLQKHLRAVPGASPKKQTVEEATGIPKTQMRNLRRMGDGTDAAFEQALQEGRQQGDLGRANVDRLLNDHDSRRKRGILAKTRHLRADRIVEQSVIAVEGAAEALSMIAEGDVSDLDAEALEEMSQRMSTAIRRVKKLEGWLRKYADSSSGARGA